MSPLFDPLTIGRVTLNHRIVLAPMTRLRADSNYIPLPFVKDYYQQRASVPGTLLITEGTVISPRHGGFANVPGIYNESQITAWQDVTKAVHEQGSYIFLQLWGFGRAAKPSLLAEEGFDLVSSSDVPMKGFFDDEMHYPKPLTEDGIEHAISDYVTAAKNAINAGFDGVEIHGANGYLVDQFIQDVTNKRTDGWGGSIEKRSRFAIEVTRAVVDAVGHDRTAIRLSPLSTVQGMGMEDPIPQFTDLVKRLADFKLAYVHVIEARDKDKEGNLQWLMDAYENAGPVIVNQNYTAESAKKALEEEYKGRDVAVSFGKPFISNPDLAFRAKNGIAFVAADPATIYANTPEGYIDYTFSEQFEATRVAA